MAYNFRNVREQSNSPLEKEVNDLAKIIAARNAKDQFDLLDETEDAFPSGVDDDIGVNFHDELYSDKQFFFDKLYQPTYEPDYDKVTLMLKGRSLGNQLRDYSGFNNHASIYGEPILVDGTLDVGLFDHGPKSIATRFNRPNSEYINLEYMQVPDNVNLHVATATTGYSLWTRFRPLSLAQNGGTRSTLWQKIDDSTPNNGKMLQWETDGTLIFINKKAGTVTAKQTAAGAISINNIYDLIVTFTVSGSVIHIYLNSTDKTLSSYGGVVNWQSTLTNHDLFFMRRGLGTAGGFAYCDFYGARLYNQVLTQTEVNNFYENKFTIRDRPLGGCMITNHSATIEPIPIASFSSVSFTGTSFAV